MEDLIGPLILFVLWLVSTVASKLSRRKPEEPEQEGTGSLKELMRQMGVDLDMDPAAGEAPVAAEHRPTASEHRRTLSETRPVAAEHTAVTSEHRQAASERLQTASEQIFEASEHQLSRGEHRRGDLRLPPPPRGSRAPRRRRRQGPPLAATVGRDLRDGLARAIVLREILGPPVSLRSEGGEPSRH